MAEPINISSLKRLHLYILWLSDLSGSFSVDRVIVRIRIRIRNTVSLSACLALSVFRNIKYV